MPLQGTSAERSGPLSVGDRLEQLSSASDADLVALCVEGDERAWEALVRRYRRLIYAVPNRAGLDVERVEEVFHQTFAKLAERIHSIREPARIRAWMVTTARRLTIDQLRAHTRDTRAVRDSETVLGHLPQDAELPLESMERLESHHLLRRAMQRLRRPCRRLLRVLFYHSSDLPPSYEAISEELGVPIGSIGPTRARCLRKLLAEYQALERE